MESINGSYLNSFSCCIIDDDRDLFDVSLLNDDDFFDDVELIKNNGVIDLTEINENAEILTPNSSVKKTNVLSLNILSTKAEDMNKPNPNGNILQRIGNKIFVKIKGNTNNNPQWIEIFISPCSKKAGRCLYRIGQMDANGNIREDLPMYVGGTEESLLARTEAHAREAANLKYARKGCRELNEALRTTKVRVKLFKDYANDPTADVWEGEIEEIQKRKATGIKDWNMVSRKQGKRGDKALENQRKIDEMLKLNAPVLKSPLLAQSKVKQLFQKSGGLKS